MERPSAATVARRTVFYIEGYDPRGPSHYHSLYTEEAAKQSAVNGVPLIVGPLRQIDAISAAWDISAPGTQTTYVFLRYDDLMWKRWSKSNVAVISDILGYFWIFLRGGLFANMYRFSRPLFIFSTFAPLLLLFALLVAAAVTVLAALVLPWVFAAVIGALVLTGTIVLRPWLEKRLDTFWLARSFKFNADQDSGISPDYDERITAFAACIAEAARDVEVDEVLIAGHSIGTSLAIPVCARCLKLMEPGAKRLSLITLGQWIPLLSAQSGSSAIRGDLLSIASDSRLDWVDVSAPADYLCYALTDPLLASGMPQAGTNKPKIVSARFVKLFTAETYKRIKRDFHRMHFQYLMAAELPGDYDYFLITAGDRPLADRFSHIPSIGRTPDKGRQ